MSMINHDIPPFALARVELGDEEIVGEVLDSEDGTVTLREFGKSESIRVSRDLVEVAR